MTAAPRENEPASDGTANDSLGPRLRVEGIRKQYPGVQALAGVEFDVRAGEVHVLVGENGAGKSTLIKILSGAVRPDEGRIFIDGSETVLTDPHSAQIHGIATIHQESNVVPYLDVAENMFLGDPPRSKSIPLLLSPTDMHREAARILQYLDLPVPTHRPVGMLGAHERKLVEIGRALRRQARVLILDEPTAALGASDVARLFNILRRLRDEGTAIVFISHQLDELHSIGDRVTVLRDGIRVGTNLLKDTPIDALIRMMIGRDLDENFAETAAPKGNELLEVEHLRAGTTLKDASFSVRAGEIVGVAGLVGSGGQELARALYGAIPIDSGAVRIGGKPARLRNPRDALRLGIYFLSADRRREGLFLDLSVKSNITMGGIKRLSRWGLIDIRREGAAASNFVRDLSIRLTHLDAPVQLLSGGNQQKVMIARALYAQSNIFIFDEPTLGVDVGAKSEIYRLLARLAGAGAAILLISSDMLELLGETTRILVMRKGKIVGNFAHGEATQELILRRATSDAA
jgi:ABC-type sugar transport system ATPase subunit